MAVLAIPFPNFDPVAFSLGPVTVKWYGLAYMAGLLLGWLYIRRLVSTPALWPNAKPPFSRERVDDLLRDPRRRVPQELREREHRHGDVAHRRIGGEADHRLAREILGKVRNQPVLPQRQQVQGVELEVEVAHAGDQRRQ